MGFPGVLGGLESAPGSLLPGGPPCVGDLIEASPGVLAHYRMDGAPGGACLDLRGDHSGSYSGTPGFVAINAPDPGAAVLPAGCTARSSGTMNFPAGGVEGWFKVAAAPTTGMGLLAGLYDSAARHDKCLDLTPHGNVNWLVNDGSDKVVSAPFPLGRWNHVVGACDGSNSRLYVNGLLAGQAGAGPTVSAYSTSGNFYIGGGTPDTFSATPGSYDEVATYSVAPTAGLVAARFAAGVGNIANTNARVSSASVEVLRDAASRSARVSGVSMEVLRDTVGRSARVGQVVVEVLASTATADPANVHRVSATDGFRLSDNASEAGPSAPPTPTIGPKPASASSRFTFTDHASATRTSPPRIYNVSASDGLKFSDHGGAGQPLHPVASGLFRLFDSASCYASPLRLGSADGFALADAASAVVIGIKHATAGDRIAFSDAPGRARSGGVAASSGLTFSDEASASRAYHASASDSFRLGDTPSGKLPPRVAASDGLRFADSATVVATGTVAGDGIAFSDAAFAAVRFSWRPNGLTLPPGGGLPHS